MSDTVQVALMSNALLAHPCQASPRPMGVRALANPSAVSLFSFQRPWAFKFEYLFLQGLEDELALGRLRGESRGEEVRFWHG